MNYNFLPEKIRKQLSAKFAEKVPFSVIRLSGCTDGSPGEGYLICYDDLLALFSRKLGEDAFSLIQGNLGSEVKSASLRKEGIDNYIDISIGGSNISVKISGLETSEAQKICDTIKKSLNKSDITASEIYSPKTAADQSSENKSSYFSNDITPLEVLAISLMFIAACDQKITENENCYILNIFRDNMELLKKAHAEYKKTSYEAFLDKISHLKLSREQKLCILANMMEMGMIDGSYHGKEQKLINSFIAATGINREDADAILNVLLVKNNLSVM